jgi:hypothetical protein
LFSDLLPGSVVDLVGANPPYSQTFQGGLLGTVGGTTIAPGAANSAVDATITANQIFNTGFATNQLSCASPLAVPNSCLRPVAMTAVPDGRLHAPYFMQWSFGLEQQIGNTIHLRAQYVGTRAVNQHFTTQVNGNFRWSDFYLTKWFTLSERAKLRIDGQFFNLFNHPNFGLPVLGYAGTPGRPSTQTGFGALSFTTSPPTDLLGVGLGGDNSPRMIAFQARLEF